MTAPLVSVVVPVYNTMPYLTECVESVLNQTLGTDRIELVAVDDGSTDGSGEELDRWAATHPDVVKVLHQPNSGGPAGPCNAGLEIATGEWVFFLGADDWLGPEGLERLVRSAADWGSDVIFGRMVGEGGRGVDQRMFRRTRRDITLLSSPLAYALSNTKLFRRRLIDDLGLRYALDLRIGSDQPFTVAALLAARRVSVLAGYPVYHAVRRTDSSNISFSTPWRTKAGDVAAIVHHLAELAPAGPVRDALFTRHFDWEIDQLLRDHVPVLADDDRAELVGVVAGLAAAYLTEPVADRLSAPARLRLRLAEAGELDRLAAVIAYGEQHPARAMTLTASGAFDWFPAVDGEALRTEDVGGRLRRRTEVTSVELADGRLRVSALVALRPESVDRLRIVAVPLAADEPVPPPGCTPRDPAADTAVTLIAGSDATGGTDGRLTADLALGSLPPGRWSLRLRARVGDRTYDQPLVGKDTAVRGDGVAVLADSAGQLVIVIENERA